MKKNLSMIALAALSVLFFSATAFAAEGEMTAASGQIAIAGAMAIGLAALGGTLAQGRAASAVFDSIGRNPGAAGKLFVPMIIGLALIESLVIIAFVIANKIIG